MALGDQGGLEGRGKALVIALTLLPKGGRESKRSLGPSIR